MRGFFPGPPYFFVCLACSHRFRRDIRFGLFCPACKSLRVRADPSVRK